MVTKTAGHPVTVFSHGDAPNPNEVNYSVRRTISIDVTPDIARQMLDAYDDGTGRIYNRTPGTVHVAKLARDMANDHWKDTGVPLIIGTHGKVLDGRQRLEAVIVSGKTIKFDVKYGIDPDAQVAMDRPRKRTFANDLQMDNVPNNNVIASLTGLILHWRSGKIFDRSATATETELRIFEQENRDMLQVAARQAAMVRHRIPPVTISVIGAAFFEAYHVDEDRCAEFFESLSVGEGLSVGNPILSLRNTLIRYDTRRKPHRTAQLYHVAYAWNLWRIGRNIQQIKVPTTLNSETFPRMK